MSLLLVPAQFYNKDGLDLVIYSQFLRGYEANWLFEDLMDMNYDAPEDSQVFVYGQWHNIPRLQTAFGDPGTSYKFSGNEVPARPWPDWLMALRDTLEDILRAQNILPLTAYLGFVLINKYRNGKDAIGHHADDEEDLKTFNSGPIIVSLSLGATRKFEFKQKKGLKKIFMDLNHGDLIIMRNQTNSLWTHSIPAMGYKVMPCMR